MATPRFAEILALTYARLSGDAALSALVGGRIFNNIPRDTPMPCLRFRWETAKEWDTKDSTGFDSILTIDTWTDHRGDKDAAAVQDALMACLHNVPLVLTSGQSLILQHGFHTAFTEADGITHHAVSQFRHIATN